MLIGETMAYNIIFYEKKNGESEVWNFLETAFSIFTMMIIPLSCFIVFVRKLKKRLSVKLKKQNLSETTIYPKRSANAYEKLERL